MLKPLLLLFHIRVFVSAACLLVAGCISLLMPCIWLLLFPIELEGLDVSVDRLRVHTFIDSRLSERTISNALVYRLFLYYLAGDN